MKAGDITILVRTKTQLDISLNISTVFIPPDAQKSLSSSVLKLGVILDNLRYHIFSFFYHDICAEANRSEGSIVS